MPNLGGLESVKPLAKVLMDGTDAGESTKLKVKIAVKRKRAKQVKTAQESKRGR